MATVPHSRINLLTPGDTILFDEAPIILRRGARYLSIRAIEVLDTIWRREPTLFIELGVGWTIAVWAATILLFGTGGYPPMIAVNIGWLPEIGLGASGTIVVLTQSVAIICHHREARGYASFAGAIWLGYLSFAILAGNHHLAGGYVYLGTAVAALLPFWRVVLDRRI